MKLSLMAVPLFFGIILTSVSSDCLAQTAPRTNWEFIEDVGGRRIDRLEVPGGWLVKTSQGRSLSVTYVPDEKKEWKPRPGIVEVPLRRIGNLVSFQVKGAAPPGGIIVGSAGSGTIWINVDQIVAVKIGGGDTLNTTAIITTAGTYNVSDFDESLAASR